MTAGPGPGRPSLLWPPGWEAKPGPSKLDARTLADLDLPEVIRALTGAESVRERFVTGVLAELCTDPEVIAFRQAVVSDFLANPALRQRLARVLPELGELVRGRNAVRAAWAVAQVAERLAELEWFVDVAVEMRAALDDSTLRSAGMLALRQHLATLTDAPQFQALRQELPRLRAQLDQARSVSIGVNLSRAFYPESAAILSLNPERVEARGPLLERLFGAGGVRAVSPLFDVDMGDARNPLYRELRKLIEQVATPVAQALSRYTAANVYALNDLEPQIHFLIHAAALAERLQQSGLPACIPQTAPAEERVTLLEEGYNVALALRVVPADPGPQDGASRIVTNRIAFDDDQARVWIVTGPNRGGKTTYIRAVGLAHVLFQAGCYVPAGAARLSPITTIYTHFATQETAEVGMGRLDEEAERLSHIFQVATDSSLILLNEVLAGTSAIEALGLATDAVRGLRLLGARAIYATHLHELASGVEELNQTTPGSARIGSLVAEVEQEGEVVRAGHRRTFRIVPGPPRGVSYASEIAEQHEISYPQLVALFQRRGLVEPGPVSS